MLPLQMLYFEDLSVGMTEDNGKFQHSTKLDHFSIETLTVLKTIAPQALPASATTRHPPTPPDTNFT